MATDNKEPVFEDLEAYFRVAKYPIVKYTDMNAEMREEASDILITAVEKFPADLEKCTQMIKDLMDKKFGPPWHVVVGKSFSYEITHEVRNIIYMYVAGTTGVLCWKL